VIALSMLEQVITCKLSAVLAGSYVKVMPKVIIPFRGQHSQNCDQQHIGIYSSRL